MTWFLDLVSNDSDVSESLEDLGLLEELARIFVVVLSLFDLLWIWFLEVRQRFVENFFADPVDKSDWSFPKYYDGTLQVEEYGLKLVVFVDSISLLLTESLQVLLLCV